MIDKELNDSGDRSVFGYGAMRDRGEKKGRFDLLPASAIARLAKHFQKGAEKYADRNWEKGMPIHMFFDSGLRHAFQYLDGDTSEDHLVAAAWNFMCAMWTEEHYPELVDIPTRPEYKERHQDIIVDMSGLDEKQISINDFWMGK